MHMRKVLTMLLAVTVILSVMLAGTFSADAAEGTPATSVEQLTKTIIRSNVADPWLFTDGEYFYLTMTGTARIAMIKSETLVGLGSTQKLDDNIVYDSALDPTVTELFGEGATLSGTWSPEVYYFSEEQYPGYAGWYMFLALRKNTGDSSTIQMVVLKSTTGDPKGPYGHPVTGEANHSQPVLDKSGNVYSNWACGMGCVTISEGAYKGLYTMWIEEVGRGQGLGNFYQKIMITKMANPWTMEREPGIVTTPTQEWEYAGSSSTHPRVVEGATAVYGTNGEVFLTYSGSGYWSNYGLGQLTWTGEDPLLTSSWHKLDTSMNPIFSAVTADNVRGAGHASFIRDAQGNGFLCYHAYPYTDGTKGNARNAYIEPYYIDYEAWNGVSYGVIHCGVNDNRVPAKTATAITFATGGEELGVPTISVSTEGYVGLTLNAAAAEGYAIYRSTDGVTFTYLGDTKTSQYIDTKAVEGKTYYYRAYSYRNEEISTVSETVSVTAPSIDGALFKPSFTATQTTDSITLNWGKIEGVDGYKIWRKAPGETEYTALKAIYDPDATSYTDSGLESGKAYSYLIRTFYKDDDGVFHFSDSSGGQLVYTKPGLPKGTVAYEPSGGVKITITEHVECTGYVYARQDASGGGYETIYYGPEDSYVDTDAEVGKTYNYRVYAYAGDISVRSDSSSLAGEKIVINPAAPVIDTIVCTDKGVTMTWNAVEGATGYKVFRKLSTSSSWDQLVKLNDLTYTDPTAEPGKTYVYAIQAYQTIGTNHYYSELADVMKTITIDADCVHNWAGGTCTKCGAMCNHPEHDPATCVCSDCGAVSAHTWSNGMCYGCEGACEHTWAGGTCTTCGKSCNHTWSEGRCTVCGLSCAHAKWIGGVCDVCHVVCEHDWSGDVCTICNLHINDDTDEDGLYTNKYVSVDADGNYMLTIEAYGKGDTSTVSYAKPADIVLVLDVSASMYTPVGANKDVATYSDETETTTVDYTGNGTAASGKTMIRSTMDITPYIIPNADLDKTLGSHMGYYIAQSESTQDWWILKYFVNEDFSPNYQNYTGWVGYRLDRVKGTGDVVHKNTLNPNNSDNKTVFGNSLPDRMTVWKTQYGALYDSVNIFLKDLRDSGVAHRVSITTFCGVNNAYTGVYNGGVMKSFWNLYGGSGPEGETTYAYTLDQVVENNHAFLQGAWKTVTDPDDYADLMASMNTIITNGAYTCPAAGIAMANTVLDTVYDGNEETRDRIVLLFTDGAPNLDLKRGHGGGPARNDAVVQAYTSKQTYGATVFSLYTSTVTDTNNANRTFLRLTSSMYPNATHYAIQDAEGAWHPDSSAWGNRVTDKEYCFQATDEESLNNAFSNISASISKPATDLTEDTVIRDVISDYFDLRDANGDGSIKPSDILVFTADYLGNGEFSELMRQPKLLATLDYTTATENDPDGDGRLDSISVSGFSFVKNYVHEATTEQEAGGRMLVIKIPIQVREGFWGGNNVPTNENDLTGVYTRDALGMRKVTGLLVPELNVQPDPGIITNDVTIYYGGTVTQPDVFKGITLNGSMITYTNDGTCTPAESWMDDYSSMTWTGYDHSFSGAEPDSYTYAVSVNHNAPGEAISIPVLEINDIWRSTSEMRDVPSAAATTAAADVKVHILKPTITFRDSSTLPGIAPAYGVTNLVEGSITWKNELGAVPGAEDVVLGQAPALTLGYDPVVDGFTADTAVNVTVTSSNGNADITDVTTFLWNCNQPLHDVPQNIETHLGSADSPEFWVHVANDTIVIDFGLGVQINVLGGRELPQGFTLVGVGKDSPKVGSSADNLLAASQADAGFGTAKIEGGKLIYNPNTMQMSSHDVFYYSAKYGDGYCYGQVTVIPATSIYYEDDFANKVSYSVYEKTDGSWDLSATKSWLVEGTADSGFQAEDRPDSGNNYGFDEAYGNCKLYSMGAAHLITVDPNTYGVATFSFTGTGVDIISRTTVDTGFVTVKIYKDGETDPMQTLAVDTYYTRDDGMYQIPVMTLKNLPYGNYRVEIKAAYSQWLDHKDADAQTGSYQFYLDAVRIYDPVGVLSGAQVNGTVSGVYDADGENYPVYMELRDMLIQAESFGSLTMDSSGTAAQVPGTVFIDSDKEVSITNYANEGPNNEVYLKPGQSIAFNLANAFVNTEGAVVMPVDVQVGMKVVSGTAAFEIYTPGTVESTVEDGNSVITTYTAVKENTYSGTLNTATEMYYSVAVLYGDTVVITNTSDSGILSITNLKFTFAEQAQHSTAAAASVTSISEADAIDVIRCLSNYNVIDIVEKETTEMLKPGDTTTEGSGETDAGDRGDTTTEGEDDNTAPEGPDSTCAPENSGNTTTPDNSGSTTTPEDPGNTTVSGAQSDNATENQDDVAPADPDDTTSQDNGSTSVPDDSSNSAGDDAEPVPEGNDEIVSEDADSTVPEDSAAAMPEDNGAADDAGAAEDETGGNSGWIWITLTVVGIIGILAWVLVKKFGKGRSN